MNSVKIRLLYNKEISIENFKKIIYCDNVKIQIDNIIITGVNLLINILEENIINIKGKIENVKFE